MSRIFLHQINWPPSLSAALSTFPSDMLGCQYAYFVFFCSDVVHAEDGATGLMFMDASRETISFFEDYEGPVFVDGTFFVSPKPFDSLLSIHLQFKDHTFPVCFFLLTGKSESLYAAALQKVKDYLPQSCSITHSMTDYERALMNGFSLHLPMDVGSITRRRCFEDYKNLDCLIPFTETHHSSA